MKRLKWKIGMILFCCIFVLSACGTTQTQENAEEQTPEPSAEQEQEQEQEQGQEEPEQEEVKEEWEVEWETVLAAAKEEGEVRIAGQPQTSREDFVAEFEKSYPEIDVKYMGNRPSDITGRILAEQQQGRYLTDILLEAGQIVETHLVPNDAVEDIKEYIILPELKKDEYWHDGFDAGYKMGNFTPQYVYAVMTMPTATINNDMIPKGEIQTAEDILDPKYKGKIVIANFARPAQGNSEMTGIWYEYGEEFVRKLLEQDPIIIDDKRQIVEALVTDRPIGIGVRISILDEFIENGVVDEISILTPETTTVLHGLPVIALKNPPNPNAAKVFVNWLLSKEGQTKWVEHTKQYPSRRTDVPEPPNVMGWDQIDYQVSTLEEEVLEIRDKALQLGKEVYTESGE